ncbi:hypothetical protein KFL_001730330 [Klebsormidium nitens]|uniref:MYND-type domain-containing protein n=1 Tax=Klebsormidium nitens TaxID=105231 RepID=A0A1Y1HZD9_KLENI|nr:hypothetical protein KFL_001730330 [Klebsormidium nitens]|eukprot:GAQ84040.1 hypothetical protein KFL_001730330 [Klebsormidium nitens]
MRDEEGLLPAVQSLFEDENIKHICENVNVYAAVRHGVIDLILSLTLAKDSQEWMIDKGFLTLLASICATDRYDMEEIPATMSCATVLWRLCDSPTLSRKIKEAGELSSILEPYSRLLNSKLRGVWDVFQETMRRRSGKASKVKAASVREIWKYNASKFIGIAAVCSWEGCSEGLDLSLAAFGLDLEGLKKIKKLSRCGRCGMAYYCSKDHQKLHWVTHKKDCFDATAN